MKKILEKVWLHKSALKQLSSEHRAYVKKIIRNNPIDFDVVRFDIATNNVTLIKVEDWNNQYEPVLVYSVTIKSDGTVSKRNESKDNPTIYHQKELFVNEDYRGFDVKEAYERTKVWKALKLPSSKIGRYKYWSEELEKAGIRYSKRVGTGC